MLRANQISEKGKRKMLFYKFACSWNDLHWEGGSIIHRKKSDFAGEKKKSWLASLVMKDKAQVTFAIIYMGDI